MDINSFNTWLSDYNHSLTSFAAIVTVIVAIPSLFWAWKSNSKPEPVPISVQTTQYSSGRDQIIASITASDKATVQVEHIGDRHYHEYDEEKVAQLAVKLATKYREEDSQTIKGLEATIKALTEQNADQYDIQQALDLLAQGNTEQAEKIFEQIASGEESKRKEMKLKDDESRFKEAEALRHLGSLAFLHNTQKALDVYRRSAELDPDNINGWNQLGHLYIRIGEIEKSESAYMTVLNLAGTNQDYQAIAYGNLGNVYQKRGELDQAIEYHEKSLAINKKLGSKEGMAITYRNLGIVYRVRGQLDQTIECWQKSLTLFTELGAAGPKAQMQAWLDNLSP